MLTENRPKFALIVALAIALGSGVTYGLDRLNTPRPIIISDAVSASPLSSIPSSPTEAVVAPAAGSGVPHVKAEARRGRSKSMQGRGSKIAKITSGVIHINTASLEDLERLPGVGPGTAKAIIDFRTQANGFQSVDDLGDVPRLGAKKLQKIMPFVAL